MTFEKKSDDCFVAFLTRERCASFTGRKFRAFEAARAVNLRGEGWRIDWCGAVAGAWLPWEPIDTITYPDAQAAQQAIREWVKKVGAKFEKN